jgi:hypothetical protein
VADVSVITVTDPALTPETPDGVNTGETPVQVVPDPVNVTVVTPFELMTGGLTASVVVTSAGL